MILFVLKQEKIICFFQLEQFSKREKYYSGEKIYC